MWIRWICFSCSGLLLLLSACQPPPHQQQVAWQQLPGWQQHDPRPALAAFTRTAAQLAKRYPAWQSLATELAARDFSTPRAARSWLRHRLQPWRLRAPQKATGLLTGYYVPELSARRQPTETYRWPIYAPSEDLLRLDLGALAPQCPDRKLRVRVAGNRVVPYYTRKQIAQRAEQLQDKALFWLRDPVERYFLQIQGSGRLRLPSGNKVMVHYADHNGRAYRSLGRLLKEQGRLQEGEISLPRLKTWSREHPQKARQLFQANPRYIFFKELPAHWQQPPGALGQPLVPGVSVAVDRQQLPLGGLLYMATSKGQPPLQRLVVAQDTGGAIQGPLRLDLFWGSGDEAAYQAGHLKARHQLWLLWPKGRVPPSVAP